MSTVLAIALLIFGIALVVGGAEIFFETDPTELRPAAAMTRGDGTFELRLEDGTYAITARFAGDTVDVPAKPLVLAGAPVSSLEITPVPPKDAPSSHER